MTGTEAIEKLKELQNLKDVEMAHSEADKILCELLDCIGYDDVVIEFHKIKKYYA